MNEQNEQHESRESTEYTITLEDVERYVQTLPPGQRLEVCIGLGCVVQQALCAKYPLMSAVFVGATTFSATVPGEKHVEGVYETLPLPVQNLIRALGFYGGRRILPGPHRCHRQARTVRDVIKALRAGAYDALLVDPAQPSPSEEENTEAHFLGVDA